MGHKTLLCNHYAVNFIKAVYPVTMRIVSLTCSNTEIVTALGCAEQLVGVDDHTDRPLDVIKNLPRVGPDLHIDMEKVTALEPDLVLASLTVPGHEKVIAGLEAANLPYLAPEPLNLEDVYSNIHTIAAALEVPERADAVIEGMQNAMPTVKADNPPSLMVEWWHRPAIAAGQISWVHDLIGKAGGRNMLQEAVKSRPLEDSEVVALNPDIIVISWCGIAFDKYRPEVIQNKSDWQGINAVKNGQVYCVPEAALGRPSPFLVDGYKALRQIVAQYQEQSQGQSQEQSQEQSHG